MDLPVERWHPAIFARVSRRVFTAAAIGTDSLARLEALAGEFRPFPGARAVVVRESPEAVFRGLLGGYGKVKGAPHYAAFIGDTSSPHLQEAVGYLGEAVILEATALGLGTCWVGGFFRPESVAGHIELGPAEKVLAVTPIGRAAGKVGLAERSMKAFVRAASRRAVTDLVIAGAARAEWQHKALEAARLAPSARNRQPWRFRVDDQSITVAMDSPRDSRGLSKRLDCGIAMLHLELGARSAGAVGRWELLAPPDVAVYRLVTPFHPGRDRV